MRRFLPQTRESVKRDAAPHARPKRRVQTCSSKRRERLRPTRRQKTGEKQGLSLSEQPNHTQLNTQASSQQHNQSVRNEDDRHLRLAQKVTQLSQLSLSASAYECEQRSQLVCDDGKAEQKTTTTTQEQCGADWRLFCRHAGQLCRMTVRPRRVANLRLAAMAMA